MYFLVCNFQFYVNATGAQRLYSSILGQVRIASDFCLSTTYAEAPGWANSDISEILLFLLRALLQ